MAAKDKKKDEKADSNEKKKGKKDWVGLILLVLIVVNLGLIAGIGHYMQKLAEQVLDLHQKVEMFTAAEEENEESPIGKELEAKRLGVLYPLEGFLVNLSSKDGARFLQTQIELELEDASVEEELVQKKAAVRDAIIVLLSSRSYRSLREPSGLKKLRTDILNSLNTVLKTGLIKEVYFTQFHFN